MMTAPQELGAGATDGKSGSLWAGTAVVGLGLRRGSGPTGLRAGTEQQGTVLGSGNQWSLGKGRLSGPLAVESPSPELRCWERCRESGRGLWLQVSPPW